jgi:hypothetical protein
MTGECADWIVVVARSCKKILRLSGANKKTFHHFIFHSLFANLLILECRAELSSRAVEQ